MRYVACDVASHGSPIARVGNSIHFVEPSSSPPKGAEVSGLSRGRETLLQPARRRGSVRAGNLISELNPGLHHQKESIKAEKHPKAGNAREWVIAVAQLLDHLTILCLPSLRGTPYAESSPVIPHQSTNPIAWPSQSSGGNSWRHTQQRLRTNARTTALLANRCHSSAWVPPTNKWVVLWPSFLSNRPADKISVP